MMSLPTITTLVGLAIFTLSGMWLLLLWRTAEQATKDTITEMLKVATVLFLCATLIISAFVVISQVASINNIKERHESACIGH